MLDHAWIAAHIPHQGSMCLIDAVLDWSPSSITCRAISHTSPSNPLRAGNRLGIASGIEYAAQAMAIHGALLAPSDAQARPGYLTSVRGVRCHAHRLDDLPGALAISAERISGDSNTILYAFSVAHAGNCLLEGRAAVVLDTSSLEKPAS